MNALCKPEEAIMNSSRSRSRYHRPTASAQFVPTLSEEYKTSSSSSSSLLLRGSSSSAAQTATATAIENRNINIHPTFYDGETSMKKMMTFPFSIATIPIMDVSISIDDAEMASHMETLRQLIQDLSH